jgi:hypothetical protein
MIFLFCVSILLLKHYKGGDGARRDTQALKQRVEKS